MEVQLVHINNREGKKTHRTSEKRHAAHLAGQRSSHGFLGEAAGAPTRVPSALPPPPSSTEPRLTKVHI